MQHLTITNLMFRADRAQPRSCRNFCQRWIKASQMINCRTRFTAQQISKPVLHSHINHLMHHSYL